MPPRFSLEYFDPAPGQERAILTSFQFARDDIEIVDCHPGALPQLSIFLSGEGEARFATHTDTVAPGAVALSGMSQAVPYTMRGPWHAVGVSLTPVGWAALSRLTAQAAFDRFLPGEEAMGPALSAFAAELVEGYRTGTLDLGAARLQLCDWVVANLGPVDAGHEALIGQVQGWLGRALNPPLDGLFEASPYSRRQTERLVERYFGLPPAALLRKYRAIRTAAFLAQPSLGDVAAAEIAEAFYDQPHMVREIRRYCGRTPSRLGGEGEPLFQTMLLMKNFDRLVAT